MQVLLVQTFIWMLLAGFIGACLGCLTRRLAASRGVAMVGAPASIPATAARVPVIEARSAPAPVAKPIAPSIETPTAQAPAAHTATLRGAPDLVQPHIQRIALPQNADAEGRGVRSTREYPITTIGIPPGYVTLTPSKPLAAVASAAAAAAQAKAASVPASAPSSPARIGTSGADATKLDVSATETQPRPEPLRPEFGRSGTSPKAETQAQSSAVPQSVTVAAASAAPAVAASAAPAAPVQRVAAASMGDDLMRIRSIDAVMQNRLRAAGVTRFKEIAGWTAADIARFSQNLGLVNRIQQESWIEQAQILAVGGETDYSRRRARGESPVTPQVPEAVASATAPSAATSVVGTAPSASGPPPAAPAQPRPAANPGAPGNVSDPSVAEAGTGAASALAAAAAMASNVMARANASVEPSMPAKLVDAIRENLVKPAPPPTASTPPEPARVSRPDLAGLRSVRSQALRDGPAIDVGRGGPLQDLKRLRGIGVLIEKKLNSLGIVSYEQIANWTSADVDRISQILDFRGRIERESWVEQARILAAGGQTEFSKRVDRGEV